jgi:hypothetical protein
MVGIVAQILGAVGVAVPPALVAKVQADGQALNKLGSDIGAAANGDQGAKAAINAELAVLAQDSAAIFQLAQVSNPQSQAKINVLIGLATSAIQLAESLFGQVTPTATMQAKAVYKANDLMNEYNRALKVKTDKDMDAACKGKSVHLHSKAVRVMTLGLAN